MKKAPQVERVSPGKGLSKRFAAMAKMQHSPEDIVDAPNWIVSSYLPLTIFG
jgi:hypothetical protein